MLVFPGSGRLAGFAADGVASVLLPDDSGSTLASAEVSDNLFVGGPLPARYATIESLDVQGKVISQLRAAATGTVRPTEAQPIGPPPVEALFRPVGGEVDEATPAKARSKGRRYPSLS